MFFPCILYLTGELDPPGPTEKAEKRHLTRGASKGKQREIVDYGGEGGSDGEEGDEYMEED